MIFSMSSRNGDESAQDSEIVGRIIGQIFYPGFSDMSEEFQQEFAVRIDHYVRKAAHATEYSILAVLAIMAFCSVGRGYLTAVIFSISDEIHQLFVPGRSGQITDVIIDGCGALIGVILIKITLKTIETYTEIKGK